MLWVDGLIVAILVAAVAFLVAAKNISDFSECGRHNKEIKAQGAE